MLRARSFTISNVLVRSHSVDDDGGEKVFHLLKFNAHNNDSRLETSTGCLPLVWGGRSMKGGVVLAGWCLGPLLFFRGSSSVRLLWLLRRLVC